MKFSFKKFICATLCGALVLTTAPAQASWYTGLFTQKNALIASVVTGATLCALWAWNKWGTTKKPIEKGTPGVLERVKTTEEKAQELFDEILSAIKNKDLSKFQTLVKNNMHVLQWRDTENKTILMYSIQNHNGWVAYNPEKKSQQMNALDNHGKTPLMYAVSAIKPGDQEKAVEFIRGLIDKAGTDVLAVDKDDNTLLHYAVQTGCVNLVKLILTKMVEKDSSINPLAIKSKKIIMKNSDSEITCEGQSLMPVTVALFKSQMLSSFKKNYCEVAAYLQCVYVVDGKVIEPTQLEYQSKLDALMRR